MNRIEIKFDTLKKNREKALIGFVSAGDPDTETSYKIISAMCDAGIDILELGIPFSDPTADGPVIQRSSARALKSGTSLSSVLEITGKIRKNFPDIPIILFSYYNPIHAYGGVNFYNEALKKGADGVLIVDLPPEESDELTCHFDKDKFSIIRLIAPTTPIDRVKMIADDAGGFLYLVSKTGVTGSDGLDTSEIETTYSKVASLSKIPVCVGFGISTAEDVKKIGSFADGIVIGSAFERIIENNIENPDLPSIMAERVKEYKAATKF